MRLPASAQQLADVLGMEQALNLIGRLPRCYPTSAKAGERVIMYVPKSLKPDHLLVSILGWQDANKLVRVFGGEILCPATCKEVYRPFRDENIVRLVKDGIPPRIVAEWFDVDESLVRKTVRRLTSGNPQEECQAANDNNMPDYTFRRRNERTA